MKPIILSINPSYFCNFRCEFCYLTKEQLADKNKLNLDDLSLLLDKVQQEYKVTHIDLYGGEVQLLPGKYLTELKTLLNSKGINDIVVITNLSTVGSFILEEDIELSVSYDFSAREHHDHVFSNMLSLPKWYNVLVLASRKLLDTITVDEFVNTFNLLSQCRCVEIKPYSENQANNHDVKFSEYEDYVWQVLTHPDRKFHFENESQIIRSVNGERNAFSDDHLYITPNGKFAVLDFDINDKELFIELNSIEEYKEWCRKEKDKVLSNPFCNKCEFNGGCLSEHLRDVKSLDNSCNGFYNLLKRYQKHEST